MSEVVYAILCLSCPFLLGIAVGIEIVRHRPASTNERFGQMVSDRILSVHRQGRWLESGSGFAVKNTMSLDLEGRTITIEIKEVA